jgi:4-amino-4-deoxy-L-arabinose transferase-like glycosyltransferase
VSSRVLPAALIGAFVVLALIYALTVPPFESPDESTHFAVVDHVAATGMLPVQDIGVKTRWEQQGSQPPLYYLLAAAFVAPIDRADLDSLYRVNPHAIIGVPGERGNKNAYLNDDAYPVFTGARGAVYLVRALSILMGAGTVYAVFQAARTLFPDRRGIAPLAAGLVAFNPQFLFISASVNNDNAVTLFASLALWRMLVMLRDGFAPRRDLALALLLALASIAKLSGLLIIPMVGLAALWTAYRKGDWRGLIRFALIAAVTWAIVAGWWYARNLSLYGELTGTGRMLDLFGRRPAPALSEFLTSEWEGLRISFWGLFGWFNVFTWQPFYRLMDILTGVAVLGALIALWQRRHDLTRIVPLALLILTLILGAISLIAWTSQTAASQGRLLFPCLVAISLLMALGLWTLRVPMPAVIVPLAAFAALVPFASIAPTYAPPAALDALPDSAVPVYARWADTALVGYEIPAQRYYPGEAIPIALYWQPQRRSSDDYSLFIRLIDTAGTDAPIAVETTYPGSGSLRTSTWQPGAIYRDRYFVRVPDGYQGRSILRAYVGWWKFPEGTPLDPVDESGEPIAQVVLDAGAISTSGVTIPAPETPVDPVDFGGAIRLIGYTLEGDVLTLVWECIGTLDEDLTVFAQVLADEYQPGGDNRIVAQGDAPPDMPTRYWHMGERFTSRHVLFSDGAPLSGTYPLYVGWYSPTRPFRLPVAAPDNAYRLTTITVR